MGISNTKFYKTDYYVDRNGIVFKKRNNNYHNKNKYNYVYDTNQKFKFKQELKNLTEEVLSNYDVDLSKLSLDENDEENEKVVLTLELKKKKPYVFYTKLIDQIEKKKLEKKKLKAIAFNFFFSNFFKGIDFKKLPKNVQKLIDKK